MTSEEKKAGASFEESRKELSNQLAACARSGVVERRVPFQNDDVPTFLERLKEFERKSRNAYITVR